MEEKRRLLEAAAPRVSLQDYIQGGPDVLQQNVEMMRDAVAAQQVRWRALCKACHALLTDREATRKNPLVP